MAQAPTPSPSREPDRPYLSTDPHAGQPVPPGYLSTDPHAGETVSEHAPRPAFDFLEGFVSSVNPLPALAAMYRAGLTPDGVFHAAQALKQTGRAMVGAQVKQFQAAGDAYQKGELSTAIGHFLAGVLPLVGPAAAHAGETIASGQVSRGLGEAAGLVAPFGVAAARGTTVTIPSLLRNRNPVEAEAAAFGLSRGIPVDAGTATGNPVVRGLEWATERTLPGSIIGERGREMSGQAFNRVGQQLADQTRPAAVTAEQAGESIREAVTRRVIDYKAQADEAYAELRRIEAQQPGIAVNLKTARQALLPLYERLRREAKLVPMIGDLGRTFLALDRLMTAPAVAPISVVDAALSDLKGLARVNLPELRTAGQGAAAHAVRQLEQQLRAAVVRAGPEAVKALDRGRRATIEKHAAGEILERLHQEPVRVYQGFVAKSDTAVDRLRDLQRYAPDELPKIGRAFLEDLLTQATVEGGFTKSGGIFGKWQSLGPETKRLLYHESGLVDSLDKFFLLAKKTAENPNPSGSAFVVGIGAQGVLLITNPALGIAIQASGGTLAWMLRNPRIVRLLTKGLQIPISNRAASLAILDELVATAGPALQPGADTRSSGPSPLPGR